MKLKTKLFSRKKLWKSPLLFCWKTIRIKETITLRFVSYVCDTRSLILREKDKLQVSKIVCAFCCDFRFSLTCRLFEGNAIAEEPDVRTIVYNELERTEEGTMFIWSEGNR
jgi:hypothetical protein